jgi:C4-dicarboxylate-specific signal transduction histidine kinase
MAIPGDAAKQNLDEHKAGDEALPASAEARLRALDAMLGGVAHDLNNALSVVLMNLDVMQQDPVLTGKHGRRIDGMLDAMTNASTLVRHLLNFSHSRRPDPEVVSVAETLESLVELLQVAVGKEIEIAIEAADETGPCCVMVDLASFEVAVVHAALQLAAMMPGGGVLTFSLGKNGPPADEVVLGLEVAPRAAASRGDEGDGLDLALIEHFARNAQGRMTRTAAGGNLYSIAIHLPACSETTSV